MDDSRAVCQICRRQLSKYTCPKCNLPYCSLSCFRSQAHVECSEAFYKREVESDIRSTPRNHAEQRDMLQLLQRFEDTATQDDDSAEALLEHNDNDNDLEGRLAGLDLEKVDPEVVWQALNEEERKRFTAIIRDADGVSARELLKLETGASPWWDNNVIDDDTSDLHSTPTVLDVDKKLAQKALAATGPPLLYNILALCIAYAYCVRTYALVSLSASSEDVAVLQSFSSLVPFLVERRSTMVLVSVEDVVSLIWSRVSPDTRTRLAQPLKDAEHLLMPVPVSPSDTHFHHLVLRVLSDLDTFVRRAAPQTLAHVPLKLAFYGAHLLALPLQVFSLLRAEIQTQVASIREPQDG